MLFGTGRNEEGWKVSSGVYVYRVAVEKNVWAETIKMILLR